MATSRSSPHRGFAGLPRRDQGRRPDHPPGQHPGQGPDPG
jgi:hypothetical protein